MKNTKQESTYYLLEQKGKNKGAMYPLSRVFVTIGRSKSTDICISDLFISGIHAHIEKKGGRFYLRDEGTWRGTQVNGENITEIPLMDGDVIRIGKTELKFVIEASDAGTPAPSDSVSAPESDHKETEEIISEEKNTPTTSDSFRDDSPEKSRETEWTPDEKVAPPFAEEEELQFINDDYEDELSLLEPTDEEELRPEEEFPENHTDEETSSQASPREKDPPHFSEDKKDSFQKLSEKIDLKDPAVRKWYNGLKSNKPALRKYAARQLEKITGQNIDPTLLQ